MTAPQVTIAISDTSLSFRNDSSLSCGDNHYQMDASLQ
jgi:hypothetical protein